MTFHDMPTIHYVLMMIAVFLAISLSGALVWFFTGSSSSGVFSLQGILSDKGSPLRVSSVTPVLNDAFVVIADITGYTQFLKGSRFSADHAQYLVLQLLDAIAEVSGPVLNFIKIEGDAILFVCDGKPLVLQGKALDQIIARMILAFYGRRRALGTKNTCPCTACRHIDVLDLKITVDLGPISSFSINEKPDISGMPVICAFRLLKVDTPHPANIILTQAASKYIKLPWRDGSKKRQYELEGIGTLKVDYHGFEPEKLNIGGMMSIAVKPGFLSVFYGKFLNNITHLSKSILQRARR